MCSFRSWDGRPPRPRTVASADWGCGRAGGRPLAEVGVLLEPPGVSPGPRTLSPLRPSAKLDKTCPHSTGGQHKLRFKKLRKYLEGRKSKQGENLPKA